jgi:CRP-like cAMP-binding protein
LVTRRSKPAAAEQQPAKQEREIKNRLLATLPEKELLLVREHLEFLDLPDHLTLHEAHDEVKYIYFPNSGMISLVIAMQDGKTVEVALVGREGATSISAASGPTRNPIREIMQISGNGYRIKIDELRKLLPVAPQFKHMLSRYTLMLNMQMAQTAACNRLHDIEQRLARWLLMAQERVESSMLMITHDFLATMLGTDRPTVSSTAGVLQKLNIINYRRGAVTILDTPKLQTFACECFGVIQRYNEEYWG